MTTTATRKPRALREDSEAMQLAVEELMLEAYEARDDAKKFFEFVMRSEDTQEPIVLAPHQRVFIDFMLAHRKAVAMLPIDHSKTFGVSALVLHMLGKNPRLRGGYVSAAEDQAKKPLDLVKRYIEQSSELRLVFPKLRRSPNYSDDWNEHAIVVDRPYGIRDPSLAAFGLDSKKITGSRWDFAVIDDSLNDENVSTPEQRDKVDRRLQKDIESRVDPRRGVVWYVNTARHLEDAVQKRVEKWPTIIMRVDGSIQIRNAPGWDSDDIRPADDLPAEDPNATYRLVAHGEDPENRIPLWPERWPVEAIEERRRDWLPEVFAQNLMNYPISDAASLCKQAYLDKCIKVAQALGVEGFAAQKSDVQVKDLKTDAYLIGPLDVLVFMGVDLAVSKASKAGETAIFVFAVFPRAIRVPLWIESGKWGASEIESKVFACIERYRPAAVAVENVAAQELFRQILAERQEELVQKDLRAPIKPFTTDKKKHDPFYGLPSLFAEMNNGLWAIPNQHGIVRPELRKWMNQCLSYTPADHTGDVLMASYFASEIAKKFGAIARARTPRDAKQGPGIAATLMAR